MGLKATQALRAAAVLVRDPFDFPASIQLADALAGWSVVQRLHERMLKGLDPERVAYLRELTLKPLDLEALGRLPENTFGYRYAAFMREHGLDMNPQVQVHPPFAKLLEENWLVARHARLHDLHHVLTGWEVKPPDELGLLVFNTRNFREPFGILALASVPIAVARHGEPARMLREVWRGWRLGREAENLFQTPLEEYLELDLDEVRRRLRLA